MAKIQIECPVKKRIADKIERAEFVGREWSKLYPDATCSLDYGRDPFRLLCQARLSAQCTDARVNIVSKDLFARFPDAESMANADLNELEKLVYPCGVYKVKAKNLRDMSRILVDRFGGRVPESREDLLSLPGIGMKIANLIRGDLFGDPMIVPDTHLIRISGRLGFTDSTVPERVENDMSALIRKADRSDFCHRAVNFGREYCKAQGARCDSCPLNLNSEKI